MVTFDKRRQPRSASRRRDICRARHARTTVDCGSSYSDPKYSSASFLKDKTKPSVLKAITQAHDVIRKLTDKPDCGIQSCPNNYLLVVTFKELYLGSGRSYYEIVAQEAMDQIYEQYDGLSVIPPENMYFITIDDLDFACAMIKDGEMSFSKMIETAKVADEKPGTRKFDFVQHLHGMPVSIDTPQYLKDRKDQLFEKLEHILAK